MRVGNETDPDPEELVSIFMVGLRRMNVHTSSKCLYVLRPPCIARSKAKAGQTLARLARLRGGNGVMEEGEGGAP